MDQSLLVMIPGPTPVARPVQDEMGREIQAFGDPRFVADYKSVIADLASLFNCGGKTFAIAGTGTLAMEMAIANSTRAGDSVLVVSNGFFGDRFADICARKGLYADVLNARWGECVSVAAVKQKLLEKHYAAITVTHVDTSTGVRAPIAEIGALTLDCPDTIYIVDGVAATGGEFTDFDGMHIDILFTGSQKAFGVCPGMLMAWASKKAIARRRALGTIPEYYIDFEKWLPVMEDPAKYFATPAINLVWALKKSLEIIKEEGVTARFSRHEANARALQAAFESLGLVVLAKPVCRAVTLSCLVYPDGVDDGAFRKAMMREGVIVAGALGAYAGKAFRVGHMGNITRNDMVVLLGAIERALISCGAPVKPGGGIGAYCAALSQA
ncbi:MAG: alanine--glyoxylate aminotransferase family protein [Clostridiales bacterium]|jgi:aspartate aminotransferase-like enzyme|nr:alanine--glyoxylate aminotransferase family protein [Clostridiales bacterium]